MNIDLNVLWNDINRMQDLLNNARIHLWQVQGNLRMRAFALGDAFDRLASFDVGFMVDEIGDLLELHGATISKENENLVTEVRKLIKIRKKLTTALSKFDKNRPPSDRPSDLEKIALALNLVTNDPDVDPEDPELSVLDWIDATLSVFENELMHKLRGG